MPITFEHVEHVYGADTPFHYAALVDVNLNIPLGKVTAIIGQTGSGKSTLVQHLNALLLPSQGKLTVLDKTIEAGKTTKGLKSLRGRVGLVFQFPEYQLFEETVLKDIAFGPKNFGVKEEEANQKAIEAMKLVGLDRELLERSPLELSGGQKRRVAIAGILAMNPEVIVLDEPTAGLDPQGTIEMMELFRKLNKTYHKTVLIVTHDMEQVFRYCADVIVMEKGSVRLHTSVKEFFHDGSLCRSMHILPPALIQFREQLTAAGYVIDDSVVTMDELAAVIAGQVKSHG
ncbi:MAG: energy-coupling factor transporter ATPase [Bulleidia sp.]